MSSFVQILRLQKFIQKKKKFIFIKRPKKISLDNTTSGDTAIYAIRKYEKKFKIKTDYVILFQPTSPFRKNTTVKKIIKLSKKHSNNQIVTVSLKNKKKPNGVLYLTPRNILFKRKNFSYKNFKSVILKSKKETLDIDTIDDFNFAKKLLNTKLKQINYLVS